MYQTMDQEIMFRELVGERYAAMEQAAKIEHALQRVRAKHPGFWRRLIGRFAHGKTRRPEPGVSVDGTLNCA